MESTTSDFLRPARIYDGGEVQYRFPCPHCGKMHMYLSSINVVRESGHADAPRPEFTVTCQCCGAEETVASLPISDALRARTKRAR